MNWIGPIILFTQLSFAMSGGEPWTAVVQDAQKAAMMKNRKAASEKLLSALRNDKWPSKGKAKLQETLKTLADVFFTDQGQRLFETGQSLAYDNPDTALARFNEALSMEDSNVTVLLAIARLQLAKKDCLGAEQSLHTADEINPYDSTLKFLQAKALLCQHKNSDAVAVLKAEPGADPVFYVTLAQALFETGDHSGAVNVLEKSANQDGSYPEARYWLWKASANNELGEEQGRKYVALCKNLNLRTRRKYLNEPRLCAQTQEVEDALKAAQKSSDN